MRPNLTKQEFQKKSGREMEREEIDRKLPSTGQGLHQF